MSTVKLPFKYARALLADLDALRLPLANLTPDALAGIQKLRTALGRHPASDAIKARRAVKAGKKAAKKDETAEIRAAVFERSLGLCEFHCGREPAEMHHAFGRVRQHQSVRNCLALCRECHRALTLNHGGAAHWWVVVADTFGRLGFRPEEETARNRAAALEMIPRTSEPKHISTVDLVGDGVAAKTWRSFQKGGEK